MGRIENGAGPVIGADPGESGDGVKNRSDARTRRCGPNLRVVAVARDENDDGRAGALAFEMELAAVHLHGTGKIAHGRTRLGPRD